MSPPEDGHQRTVRDFLCSNLKTLTTLFLIFGTIGVIVLIVMVHKSRFESTQASAEEACLDVAVVGAGIAGAYTAWRLREKGLRIHLYELSDRIGGRFYTRTVPDIPNRNAELGAMYYVPQKHTLLNSAIRALNLNPIATPPSMNPSPSTYYLRGVHLTRENLNTDKHPYQLDPDERYRTPDDLRKLYLNRAANNISLDDASLLAAQTADGTQLYKTGYWNMLGRFGSREGYNFLYDTVPWRSLLGNDNAAMLASIGHGPTGTSEDAQYMTVAEGMDSIPKRMVHEFQNYSIDHEFHKNRRLACIKKKSYGFIMTFVKTVSKGGITYDTRVDYKICAKKIVLATPLRALKRLDWEPFNKMAHIKEYMDSVHEIPALRVFHAYDKPWWTKSKVKRRHVVTDLPIRQTMHVNGDYPDGSHRSLFMVVNADAVDTEYFQGLTSKKTHTGSVYVDMPKCNKTLPIFNDINAQLQRVYGVTKEQIGKPYYMLLHDWTAEPYGAGWYVWKKGVDWVKVASRMLHPVPTDKVYVVGSTFCGGRCQLSAEGALQTVEKVVYKYFTHFVYGG